MANVPNSTKIGNVFGRLHKLTADRRGLAKGLAAGNSRRCYSGHMALRAIVHNGRLVLDEPTALPEGTVLDLVVDDESDDLDDDERALLHARLDAAWQSAKAGQVRPAGDVFEELRRRT